MDFHLRAADRMWPILNRMMDGHAVIYRASGGRIGHRFPGAPPMLLLDHVGAKSGTVRTTPLVYFNDGPNVVIVASKGGHPRHPSWYHNLRAYPDTTIQVGTERRAVHARVAEPEERARL
jgi:F420H(2)-dependent quinone reductase